MRWLRKLFDRMFARDLVAACRRGRTPVDHDADAVDHEGFEICSTYLPGWRRP